tara:strand:- start:526 stop:762 length:237 start_codon:yes stop_codon:yes gene_type:complete
MGIRDSNLLKPTGDVYDVYSKSTRDEFLKLNGDVVAPSRHLAKAYAYQMYQESTWVEMIAVSRKDTVQIIDDGNIIDG